MHEMSIAQSLLDLVLEEGQKHKLRRVSTVIVQVGALAALVPDSLQFCWELLTRHTMAAGSSLKIETVPVVVRCFGCGELFEVENHIFQCPGCEQPALDLVSGRELSLMSLEGETGDTDDPDDDSRSEKHPPGQ